MIWRHFLSAVHELWVWIVAAAVLLCLLGGADNQRKAKASQEGHIEFARNTRSFWAWPVLVALLIYLNVIQWMDLHGRLWNLIIAVYLGILTVSLVRAFPETIVATADGLEQVFWLRKNKRIPWGDIAEINTGKKSRTITVRSAEGTKIVHSRQLPDRLRLLRELQDHCGENLPPDFLVLLDSDHERDRGGGR